MHARNVKLPRNKIFVKCCMSLNDATQDGRKWKLWDIRGPEHFPENWKTKHHNSYPNELSKNWSFVPGIISDADEDDWDIKVLVMMGRVICQPVIISQDYLDFLNKNVTERNSKIIPSSHQQACFCFSFKKSSSFIINLSRKLNFGR